MGGYKDILTRAPLRHWLYRNVSFLNGKHHTYAWISLVWVAFTDVYVRMCAMGNWTDWRLV